MTIKTRGTLQLYLMKSKISRQQTFKDTRIKAFKINNMSTGIRSTIYFIKPEVSEKHNAAMSTIDTVHKKGVLKLFTAIKENLRPY